VTFVALDFETADPMRDSACALALVRVEGGRIAARATRLLRPPRREFWFTHIHGITWPMVAGEEPFGEAWPAMEPLLRGADFLAAHNAVFDRSVMRACCEAAGFDAPDAPYLCTVQLARRVWGIRPTRLPDVCGRLDIPLRHHDAGSDAEACARIVLRAIEDGGRGALAALLPAATGASAWPPRDPASPRR
jgi:DNA polymerase-3 subunit epsilon